jgi:hypothetical protein
MVILVMGFDPKEWGLQRVHVAPSVTRPRWMGDEPAYDGILRKRRASRKDKALGRDSLLGHGGDFPEMDEHAGQDTVTSASWTAETREALFGFGGYVLMLNAANAYTCVEANDNMVGASQKDIGLPMAFCIW